MKYFTISELIKSDTAIKKKLWNGASREVEDNLTSLVDNVLDPARAKYGKAIGVSSGYRSEAVNKSVGGEKGSQHLKGEAADIYGANTTENLRIAQIISELGKFDQLIVEDVPSATLIRPAWVHVSWKRLGNNRRQILRKIKGKAGYATIQAKELV